MKRATGYVKGRISGVPGTYSVELFLNTGPCNADVEARKFKKLVNVTIPASASTKTFQTYIGRLVGTVSVTKTVTRTGAAGGTSAISACRGPS